MNTRRSLLAALVATTTLTATSASARPPFRRWGQYGNGGGGGGGGSFSVTGSSYGDATYGAFKPVLLDASTARTPTVAAGDEAIYLQEEMAPGYSPASTSFLVGGSDAVWWEAGSTAGTIIMKAATRASFPTGITHSLTVTATNANGSAAAKTLTVKIPATNKEYFIAQSGVNTSVGTGGGDGSFTKPWKYLPGSADFAGTAKTFAGGDYIFLKAEVHRTTHANSKTNVAGVNVSTISGATGNPVWVELNGWGGRATLSGDQVITGGTTCIQADCPGNPNYASIKKFDLTSQGGAMQWWQMVYDGASMLYPAQYPTPITDLRQSRLVDTVSSFGSEKYGLKNVTVSTSGTRRMFTDNGGNPAASGTVITLVDPDIAARYTGDIDATTMPRMLHWGSGNFINEFEMTTYTPGTSTVTINNTSSLNSPNSYTAWGFILHPRDIVQAGQFALSKDGLTLYAWLPNNSTISISRLYQAIPWGQSGYVTYHGGVVQRYANGTTRGAVNKSCGIVHWYGSNYYQPEAHIENVWLTQNKQENAGLIYSQAGSGAGSAGLTGSNIRLCRADDNQESSFIRLGADFIGTTGGSWSAIRAGNAGRIEGNWAPDYGIGQTFCLLTCSDGLHFQYNGVRGLITTHGNFASTYDGSSSAYNANLVLEYNLHDASARFYTTQIAKVGSRNIFVGNNMVLNCIGQFGVFQLNGGEAGGRITRNLAMSNVVGYTYTSTMEIGAGGAEIDHNVIAGLNSTSGTGWTGNVHDNLITANHTLSASVAGGIYASNTKYVSPNEVYVWDGTFTSDMQAALGAGQIGPFWTI